VLATNYELVSKSAMANLWLPAEYKERCKVENITYYPQDKGRHSNTYASKDLERGEPAIKLKAINLIEVKKLLSAVN
jgi:hypothetical protein